MVEYRYVIFRGASEKHNYMLPDDLHEQCIARIKERKKPVTGL